MLFENTIRKLKTSHTIHSVSEYAFATASGDLGWTFCREIFALSLSSRTKNFFFGVGTESGYEIEDVAHFLRATEQHLIKLGKEIHPMSKFYHVNHKSFLHPEEVLQPNVMSINISPFWMKHSLQRGLLTVLLRTGRYFHSPYGKQQYKEALEADDYANKTKEAIRCFLSGQDIAVRPRGRAGGWVNYFGKTRNMTECFE